MTTPKTKTSAPREAGESSRGDRTLDEHLTSLASAQAAAPTPAQEPQRWLADLPLHYGNLQREHAETAAKLAQAEAQRDALLAALRRIMNGPRTDEACAQARAAIASAEGRGE